MKKILLLMCAALCFLGCDNPNSSKTGKGNGNGDGIDLEKLTETTPGSGFYSFLTAGHYRVVGDREASYELTDENTMITYWGGVEQTAYGSNKLHGYKLSKKTDSELELESTSEDEDKNIKYRNTYTFTKFPGGLIEVLKIAASKDGDKPWFKDRPRIFNMRKGEKYEPFLCVEMDDFRANEGSLLFEYNMKLSDHSISACVVVTEDVEDGKEVKDFVYDFMNSRGVVVGNLKPGNYIVKLHFDCEDWNPKRMTKIFKVTIPEPKQ